MGYKVKTDGYEVLPAAMTVDEVSSVEGGEVYNCQSCQCNCHLCRGGSPDRSPESSVEKMTEEAFEELLAA